MTALGLIEGVCRALYRDDAFNESVYPLDEKINLLKINENRSRYTQMFAYNAAKLYAELTEADAVSTIEAMLGIKIDEKQLAKVGQAVAENYIRPLDANAPKDQADAEETIKDIERQPLTNTAEKGFLAEKLRELEARADKDTIIQAAVNGNLDGAEGIEPTLFVLYLSADGTGVPGLRRELSNNGKNGGKAGTFEAKIGCAFRQGFTASGEPILDSDNIVRIPSTTKYTGTTDKIGGFCPQFAEFASQNGISSADQVVFISDGASWLRNMQLSLCPTAISVVDFFHAAEHLDDVIGVLRFHSTEKREAFYKQCRSLLEYGDIEQLIIQICNKTNPSNKEKVNKMLAYFERNASRMRYGLFKAAGLFIGSGVIEAACKTIVAKRLKNAGSHWSKKNANDVIALRCAIRSNEYVIPRTEPLSA